MVIDTSAFLAILQDEPDRPSFTKAIAAAGAPDIGGLLPRSLDCP